MTKQQLSLLIDLALVVQQMAPPDAQRSINRRLEELRTEQDEHADETIRGLGTQ